MRSIISNSSDSIYHYLVAALTQLHVDTLQQSKQIFKLPLLPVRAYVHFDQDRDTILSLLHTSDVSASETQEKSSVKRENAIAIASAR